MSDLGWWLVIAAIVVIALIPVNSKSRGDTIPLWFLMWLFFWGSSSSASAGSQAQGEEAPADDDDLCDDFDNNQCDYFDDIDFGGGDGGGD